MVYENNIPKTETIYELKENTYEIKTSKLSPVARSKIIRMYGSNYVSENRESYGPCSDDDYCDCSCRRKSDCNHLINYKIYGGEGSGTSKGSLKYKLDLDGVEFKEKVSASIRCEKTDYDETNYFNVSAGASIGLTSEGVNLGAKAGIDLVKYENEDGFKARAGVNVDTGISVENGFEFKLFGAGLSIGKKMGISTPFGEISKTNDNCIVQ